MNRVYRGFVFLAVVALSAALGSQALAQAGPYQYYAVTPCRVLDTRDPNPSLNQGGVLNTGGGRNFTVKTRCGVPAGATAATINVTITGPNQAGYLTLWPSGGAQPTVSTINFNAGEPALANGAIVPLAAAPPDLSIFYGVGVFGTWSVHVILDVTGYFAP